MEEYYIVMHPGDQPRPMQIIDGEPRMLAPDDPILTGNGPVPSGTGTSVVVVDESGKSMDGYVLLYLLPLNI